MGKVREISRRVWPERAGQGELAKESWEVDGLLDSLLTWLLKRQNLRNRAESCIRKYPIETWTVYIYTGPHADRYRLTNEPITRCAYDDRTEKLGEGMALPDKLQGYDGRRAASSAGW